LGKRLKMRFAALKKKGKGRGRLRGSSCTFFWGQTQGKGGGSSRREVVGKKARFQDRNDMEIREERLENCDLVMEAWEISVEGTEYRKAGKFWGLKRRLSVVKGKGTVLPSTQKG